MTLPKNVTEVTTCHSKDWLHSKYLALMRAEQEFQEFLAYRIASNFAVAFVHSVISAHKSDVRQSSS